MRAHVSLSFLLIWNLNDKYLHTLPQFAWKPCIIPEKLVYTRFQAEKAHIPFGAAQTYLTCIREITNLQGIGL